MRRSYVQSSVIQSAGFKAGEQLLEIEFRGTGYVYQYRQVPVRVFRALMRASSKGRYYNACIKDKYAFKKL